MKNTDWIGNTISISMLAALAVASWALSEFLQHGWLETAPQADRAPNAIVDRPRVIRTDANGTPQYRLEAGRMTFVQQTDRSLLEQPVMTSLAAGKPKTILQSDTAIGTNGQKQLELIGNVRIHQEAFGSQPQTRVFTRQMMVFLDEERAVTDEPVLVQRGASSLQGIGMRFDQKTQRLEIVSESRMVMPKESK